MREGDTLPLDRQVVLLTGKSHPNALFIPTASSDSVDYFLSFYHIYGEKLGCDTDVLYLIREKPAYAILKAKIEAADLIYVGGGNTLMMMKIWRRLGVDGLLKAAYERGTVMAGLSAGAICWFACGHSDSMSFSNQPDWNYVRVRGLGLVNALYCPHLNSENRTEPFKRMIQKNGALVGIGCEDGCAIEIVDGAYRIIGRGSAYKFTRQRGGEVKQEKIEPHTLYLPLEQLLSG